MRFLLRQVHPENCAAFLNAQTLFDHTALHWACVYGQAAVAEELILSGCGTSVLNDHGKAAWDLAEIDGTPSLLAVFERNYLFYLEQSLTSSTRETSNSSQRPSRRCARRRRGAAADPTSRTLSATTSSSTRSG